MSSNRCEIPPRVKTDSGETRRVGVEIEVSGMGYNEFVDLCGRLLEGKPAEESRYVSSVDTKHGKFVIELDSKMVKELDPDDERIPESLRNIGRDMLDVFDAAAERLVPMEIVSPPLPVDELELMEHLCDELREAGALGSREAILYAFGLQLNPELPDLEPSTLVRWLQSFAALYEWLKSRHQLDISRKFTTYIEPWSSKYVDLLIAEDYAPDQKTLMEDYLKTNPTRNRAMDLLPLFAHLDEALLNEYVDDPRIKSRPTLHYRLPDCDIDNPKWHFSSVWNDWVIVEKLANQPEKLAELLSEFRHSREINLHSLTHRWKETSHQWLSDNGFI